MNSNKYHIKRALLICLFLLIPSIVLSGSDGGFQNVNSSSKSSVEKINICLEQSIIARENCCWQDSYNFADTALQLANQIGYDQGIAQSKVKLGIYHIITSNYNSALDLLFDALKIFRDLEDLPGQAVVFNALGRLYHNLGSFQKAESYLATSLELKKQVNDSLQIGIAYMNLANLKLDMEEYEQALQMHFNALSIFQNMNDSLNISKEYNNLANAYFETGDIDRALKYHHISIEVKQVIKDYDGLASSYCNIGNIYTDLNEYEKAIDYFNKALTIAKNNIIQYEVNIIFLNMGRAYLFNNNFIQAEKCFNKSLLLSTELNDSLGLAKANMKFAELYFSQSEYNKAIKYCQTANELFSQLDLADRHAESILFLATVYKQKQDMRLAYQYQALYANIKDSLNIIAKNDLIASFEAKNIAENKIQQFEYENLLQEKELSNQKLTIVLLGSFSLILLISMIIILKMRKVISRNYVLLDKANEQFFHIDGALSQDMQNDLFYLSYHFAKISKDQENKEALDTYRKFVDKFNKLKQYIVSEAK